MSKQILVSDALQESNDFRELFLVRDGILLFCMWSFWAHVDSATFTSFSKVIALFFVARYVLSETTQMKLVNTDKTQTKHFQLSGRLGIMVLLLLFAKDHVLTDKFYGIPTPYVVSLSVLLFGVLQVVTQDSFTSEVVFTWLAARALYDAK